MVDKSENALQLARELGAHETVLSGNDEETLKKVQDITGGGAEVVFDFVGEQGLEKLGPRMLKGRGDYYVIGYGGSIDLLTIDIISQEINVIGNLVGTYRDLVELMTLTAEGKISLTTAVYSLDAFADAINDLDQGKLVGRGILVP